MNKAILISVIVSTFNRPQALRLVLDALLEQTDCGFQIVIADDGSDGDTRALIIDYQKKARIQILHVWQPHQGFRLAQIRNKAVKMSTGEYLLFLDGDCIPSPDWVENNRRMAEQGWMVQGQRIQTNSTFADTILQEERFEFPKPTEVRTYRLWESGAINRVGPLLRIPFECFRKCRSNDWKHVRGCNFATWRGDFLYVHGFDASFEGWGLEDSDLCVRLLNAGVKIKYGYYSSVVMHIWHKSHVATNDKMAIVQERWQRKEIYPSCGI